MTAITANHVKTLDNGIKQAALTKVLRCVHLRILVLSALFLFSRRAGADTFIVTDTSDSTKITSLRGAIIAASNNGRINTIILGKSSGFRARSHPSVYPLTIFGAERYSPRAGELVITHGDLTIIGAGTNVTIDASALSNRVFRVLPGARLNLENLTITGGNTAIYAAGAQDGGAIYNAGILYLDNCVLAGNTTGGGGFPAVPLASLNGGDGGAIYNSGWLAMCQCVVAFNACGAGSVDPLFGVGGNGGNGGGICNSGTMTLTQCIITTNFSGLGGSGGPNNSQGIFPSESEPGGPGGNAGNGGGICNSGQCTINDSTICYNQTGYGGVGFSGSGGGNGGNGGNGAGIFNSGKLILNTSTVGQNLCGIGSFGGISVVNGGGGNAGDGGNGGSGGGIYNQGALISTSSTIVYNFTGSGANGGNCYGGDPTNALPGAGGAGGSGGGICNDANGAGVIVRNTLISLNEPNVGGSGGTAYYSDSIPYSQAPAGTNGIGSDLAGGFASQGFNLVGTGDGSTGFFNGNNADQVGTDANPVIPYIGLLQMNGGFTPTYELFGISPAINQGKSFGIHRDQRGVPRPHVYPIIPKPPGGDGADIGAYEYTGPFLPDF